MFLTSTLEVWPIANIWELEGKKFPLNSNFLICLLSETKLFNPFLTLCYYVMVLSSDNHHLSLALLWQSWQAWKRFHVQLVIGLFRQHILSLFFFLLLKKSQAILKAEKRDPFLTHCFEGRTCCYARASELWFLFYSPSVTWMLAKTVKRARKENLHPGTLQLPEQ